MSALSGNRRRLNPSKVYVAQKTAVAKIEIAKKVVLERAEKDAKFAADVLKAVGSELTDEARAVCEKSVKEAKQKALIEKWEKTGLLNGTGSNNPDMAVLIPSQEKQLLLTPEERLLEETRGLVKKWEKTGLMDGLKNETKMSNMSVLLESQPTQINADGTVTHLKEPTKEITDDMGNAVEVKSVEK